MGRRDNPLTFAEGVIIKSPQRPGTDTGRTHSGRTAGRSDPGLAILALRVLADSLDRFGRPPGGAGPLRRRLAILCLWGLLGVGLGCGLCSRRLRAEYYWLQARDLEGRCDYEAARQALETAVDLCPEFGRLERTWLLAGKLDYRAARPTPQVQFFRAYQFARDREAPRAVAYREDLPWLIARTFDYREGWAAPPAGFDLTEPLSLTGTETYPGTEDYRLGLSWPQGYWQPAYRFDRATGSQHALALMEDLLRDGGERHAVVRNQASRLWADRAMNYFDSAP